MKTRREAEVGGHVAKGKRKDRSSAREENRCRRGVRGKRRLARSGWTRKGDEGAANDRERAGTPRKKSHGGDGGEGEEGETGSERGREETSEKGARVRTRARERSRRGLRSNRARIERARGATTIRSQGRSLLLPQSGDLSGMYYSPSRARYDDPSSLALQLPPFCRAV